MDVAAEDVDEFTRPPRRNLEAEVIATVTEETAHDDGVERRHDRGPFPRIPRLQRCSEAPGWCMSRRSTATRRRGLPARFAERMQTMLSDLNVASRQGPFRAFRLHHRRGAPCSCRSAVLSS